MFSSYSKQGLGKTPRGVDIHGIRGPASHQPSSSSSFKTTSKPTFSLRPPQAQTIHSTGFSLSQPSVSTSNSNYFPLSQPSVSTNNSKTSARFPIKSSTNSSYSFVAPKISTKPSVAPPHPATKPQPPLHALHLEQLQKDLQAHVDRSLKTFGQNNDRHLQNALEAHARQLHAQVSTQLRDHTCDVDRRVQTQLADQWNQVQATLTATVSKFKQGWAEWMGNLWGKEEDAVPEEQPPALRPHPTHFEQVRPPTPMRHCSPVMPRASMPRRRSVGFDAAVIPAPRHSETSRRANVSTEERPLTPPSSPTHRPGTPSRRRTKTVILPSQQSDISGVTFSQAEERSESSHKRKSLSSIPANSSSSKKRKSSSDSQSSALMKRKLSSASQPTGRSKPRTKKAPTPCKAKKAAGKQSFLSPLQRLTNRKKITPDKKLSQQSTSRPSRRKSCFGKKNGGARSSAYADDSGSRFFSFGFGK